MLKIDINLIFTVINVLILFVAVRKFLWKPIHKILEERQAMIENELTEAQKAKEEAQALQQQRADELAGIAADKEAAVAEARQKAGEAYEQIVADAKGEAQGIIKKAEEDAKREKQAVLQEAQGEIRDMVLAATARVMGAQAGTDSDLYDRFLEKVGATGDEGNA